MSNSSFNFLLSPDLAAFGNVVAFKAGFIISDGPPLAEVGQICEVLTTQNNVMFEAEIVGFESGQLLLLPYEDIHGLAIDATIRIKPQANCADDYYQSLLGQVVNYQLSPYSSNGHITNEVNLTPLKPIGPQDRKPITEKLRSGVAIVDTLLPIGKGQRLGIFAGSGVGKSSLLLELIDLPADVRIIALIGERGREVNELLAAIPDAVLATTIVIVATSDQPALARKKAFFQAHALAQYFSKKGQEVLLLADSVTRFAMAMREQGIALGEPPSSRGYTPSVFQTLPKLFEQAGNFKHQSAITALYTVLIEGDDFNDPISDACRALLDGHICLSRDLANQGLYPPVDPLLSISRLTGAVFNVDEQQRANEIKKLFHRYQKARALMDIGGYKKGEDDLLDSVVDKVLALEEIFYSLKKDRSRNNDQALEKSIDKLLAKAVL